MRDDLRKIIEARLFGYDNGNKGVEAKKWNKIINETFLEILKENEAKAKLMKLRYFAGNSADCACAAVAIGNTTYRMWRADIMGRVCAKAAREKLIKP